MQDATQDNAGIYKCIVKNEQGEINANLTLNIQVAPEDQVDSVERKESVTMRKTSQTTSTEQTTKTSVTRKRSVILQCTVVGDTDVKIDWFKEGAELQTTESSAESRFGIEKKVSEVKGDETVVQLEIMEASVDDKGSYELVATSAEGEKQSQTVTLTEETIVASLAAAQADEGDGKKKIWPSEVPNQKKLRQIFT